MTFIADLHIHSRFSMATSRGLCIPSLAGWALRKGIDVLGTGDFTHPAWMRELRDELAYDEESGLLKPRMPARIDWPAPDGPGPRFCLQAEISCVYKHGGKTRKVHNLVFMPDFASAEAFSNKLAKYGRLASDGRPSVALASHELLELALEASPGAAFIPAHIWTPWFGLLGSKSGYDSVEECFGALAGHIFALETGLSSDPPMNRLWSRLDRYAMISNSDAHSGPNLGREANLFSGAPSYQGSFAALRAASQRRPPAAEGCAFLGTLEYYPEKGKYHHDGHRACGVSLSPSQTRGLAGVCPVCGKKLTIGVLNRVTQLADRSSPALPPHEPRTRMQLPLADVAAELLGASPSSQKTERKCQELVAALGAELDILCLMPIERIEAVWPALAAAVGRMRRGQVEIEPGFDGQYGQVSARASGARP